MAVFQQPHQFSTRFKTLFSLETSTIEKSVGQHDRNPNRRWKFLLTANTEILGNGNGCYSSFFLVLYYTGFIVKNLFIRTWATKNPIVRFSPLPPWLRSILLSFCIKLIIATSWSLPVMSNLYCNEKKNLLSNVFGNFKRYCSNKACIKQKNLWRATFAM